MKNRKVRIAVILSITVILVAILFVVFKIYAGKYYKASKDAIWASQIGSETVDISKTYVGANEALVFTPRNIKAGLIFYPGGKVQYEAYAPLMLKCAEKGMFCVLIQMPDNLAILDENAAKDTIKKFPEVGNWYIAGHSLGGVMSAKYVEENPNRVKGIIFLGSYSTEDLSNEDIKKLSIYGSEDKVLNIEKYNEAKKNLGDNFTEIVIPGGCHSYFGDYGMQEGDGNPTISRDEQMDITASAICDIIGDKE